MEEFFATWQVPPIIPNSAQHIFNLYFVNDRFVEQVMMKDSADLGRDQVQVQHRQRAKQQQSEFCSQNRATDLTSVENGSGAALCKPLIRVVDDCGMAGLGQDASSRDISVR